MQVYVFVIGVDTGASHGSTRIVHDADLVGFVHPEDLASVKLYSTVAPSDLKYDSSWSVDEIMSRYLLHTYGKSVRIDITKCDITDDVRGQQEEHVQQLMKNIVCGTWC